MKRGRAFVSGLLFAAILAAIALLPLPHRVTSSLVVRPDQAQRVYVSAPGVLKKHHVKPGDEVVAGTVLAELENPDTALAIASLAGQLAQQQMHLQSLAQRRASDPTVASAIPAARTAVEDLQHALEQLRGDQQRLRLTANIDGTIMPPPEKTVPELGQDGPLPNWSGTPLEPQNEARSWTPVRCSASSGSAPNEGHLVD